jgi:hypothetical protein
MIVGLLIAPAFATAEVVRVDVSSRAPLGNSGYETIVGIVHMAVKPGDPRNKVIADLDKAPVDSSGRVTFSADLYIMRPLDGSRSNGVALVDILNRGSKTVLRHFSRAERPVVGESAVPLGDEWLLKQGYTLAWVGWQFDVPRRGGAMGIAVPSAKGVHGIVRATFTPNTRTTSTTVVDLAGYTPVDPSGADSTLTVRDGPFGRPEAIAREQWTLNGHTVTMASGFVPGRTYEVAYRAADPPIAGLGLAAVRDVGSWLKFQPDALAPSRYVYTFGSSQSGRFLRTFLYYGFNSDERDRQVFDAVFSHIAGAARVSLNERWATPNALGLWSATLAPFSDAPETKTAAEGLLGNDRARRHQPKVFYTNSDVEYWGGGRAAALVHTASDGSADLTVPDNVRVYHLTGTQHSPAQFPATRSTGQQPDNPIEYGWTLRALLVSLDGWVKSGAAPPASQYPTLSSGTLVKTEAATFPAIPHVRSPRTIDPPRQGARQFPLLVPAVDADGNDRAGIRVPEVAVPLATYTGWNFRHESIGGASQLVNLLGSAIPFAATAAERQASGDPRLSIAERYATKVRYLELVNQAADALVRDCYLLAGDRAHVVARATRAWEVATDDRRSTSASR